jgi:hypothetical protein
VNVFLGVSINWDYFFFFVLAGYVGGSLGLEILFANLPDESLAGTRMPARSPEVAPPPAPRRLPPAEPEPFRYASWDDEEERGR